LTSGWERDQSSTVVAEEDIEVVHLEEGEGEENRIPPHLLVPEEVKRWYGRNGGMFSLFYPIFFYT
jgi:hypothetical protein